MPNFKSVVYLLLVDFGEGYLLLDSYLLTCDGGKTKSTPSPTDFDCTVKLDWSSALFNPIMPFNMNKRITLFCLFHAFLYDCPRESANVKISKISVFQLKNIGN